MNVWLSFVCLVPLLVCAMASVICKHGAKNHAVDSATVVRCKYECLRADYMVHTKNPSGQPIRFRQSSFTCSSRNLSCYREKDTCKQFNEGIENSVPGVVSRISNCKTICCFTFFCNEPDASTYWGPDIDHTSNGPGNTTLPSTVSTSAAVASTTRPDVFETTTNRSFSCYRGTLSFYRDWYWSSPCTTACMTNEIDVTGKFKAQTKHFHQTTFACVPSLDYCNGTIYCNQMRNQISKLEIRSVSNPVAHNCKTKCCHTSNCNTKDPSRSYFLKSGTERTASQCIFLCTISILTAFKLHFLL